MCKLMRTLGNLYATKVVPRTRSKKKIPPPSTQLRVFYPTSPPLNQPFAQTLLWQELLQVKNRIHKQKQEY